MFDLTSGKLLLLGIVALIVLGPRDFPILLRTIGKYIGIIKRQADEFRAQFDEAIRESELDQIKKDVEGLGKDLDERVRETGQAISTDLGSVTKDIDDFRSAVTNQVEKPLAEAGPSAGQPATAHAPAGGSGAGAGPEPSASTVQAAAPHDADGVPLQQMGEVPDIPANSAVSAPVETEHAAMNGSGGHVASQGSAEPAAPAAPKTGA